MAKFLDNNGLSYFFNSLKAIFATINDVDAVNAQLYPTIAGVTINETTGAMELWSQNLNNVTATGFYNAMTCTNAKYQYSTLIVIGYYLSGYCLQIQQDVTTGKIATRSQINGTWSAWQEFDIARVQTQSNWNESDSSSEAFIQNKPTIPANTSDLTNDSGFITQNDIGNVFTIKGSVSYYSNLPASGNTIGDVYYVENDQTISGVFYAGNVGYIWITINNVNQWEQLGQTIDVSALQTKITANGVLQGNGSGGVTAKSVDSSPTSGSSNLITSGAVYSAIIGAIEGGY